MEVSVLKDCKQFRIIDENILSINTDNNFIINNKLIAEGDFSIRSVFSNNVILFDESNEEVFVFNKNGDLLWRNSDYLLGIHGKLDERNNYLVSINDGGNKYNAIFNLDTFQITNTYDRKLGLAGKINLISNNTFISYNRKKIALFDLNNHSIWQHKFSDLIQDSQAYLRSDLLHVNGKLYFAINSHEGGKPSIVCLDVQSGKVIEHFPGNFYGLFKDETHVYSTKYENIVCKIDPISNTLEEWDVNELLKQNNFHTINDHRCAAQGGKFYYTQTFGANKAKLGILDFDKRTLDYKYDFEATNGAIGSIKVDDDRIFVHTQDNTLHIFEKQESVDASVAQSL